MNKDYVIFSRLLSYLAAATIRSELCVSSLFGISINSYQRVSHKVHSRAKVQISCSVWMLCITSFNNVLKYEL